MSVIPLFISIQVATLTIRGDLKLIETHPHILFDYANDEEKWLIEYDLAYERVTAACFTTG